MNVQSLSQKHMRLLSLLLAVFLVLFACREGCLALPDRIPDRSLWGGQEETSLSEGSGTLFRLMEDARESSGIHETELLRRSLKKGADEKGGREPVSNLFLLPCQILLPHAASGIICISFTISYSLSIILRFIERQDGAKRLSF